MRWFVLALAITVFADAVGAQAGTVFFGESGKKSVSESIGTVEVPIVRSGNDGDVTVDFETYFIAGQADASDFEAKSGSLSFATSGIKKIPIRVFDDGLYEQAETFGIRIVAARLTASGASYPIVAPSTFIVTILANDRRAGQFSFVSSTANVAESAGYITLVVTRTMGADGPITLRYQTLPSTARNVEDFVPVDSSLSWANGDSSSKSFNISIVDDAAFEPAETFRVDLIPPDVSTTATLGISTVVVTIDGPNDQVAGSCQFEEPSVSVSESSRDISITVLRTGGTDGDVSCGYRAVDGTATFQDYSVSRGVIEWLSGDSTPQTIVATITDDNVYELDETFTVLLDTPAGGISVGTPGDYSVTITGPNDQEPGIVGFRTVGPTYVDESVGFVDIYVERESGSDGVVSVGFTARGFEAESGDDFNVTDGRLEWLNGDVNSKWIRVKIIDDTMYEGVESFELGINDPVGFGTAPGLKANFTKSLIIIRTSDQNAGIVNFAVSSVSFAEGAGSAYIDVVRSGGSDGAVSVQVTTEAGTAASDQDFTATTRVLTWADGVIGAVSFVVPIIDDSIFESGDEFFTVRLSNPTSPLAIGTVASARIVILGPSDRNPGVLRFTVASLSTLEAATVVRLNVERVGGSDGSVTVDYASSDVTALADSDYTSVSGRLTWADRDITVFPIDVTILDDNVYELTETFRVSLLSPVDGAVISSTRGFVTISIVGPNDQVAGNATLPSRSHRTTEGSRGISIPVYRLGGKDGRVSVRVRTVDDTAIENLDYVGVDTILTWENGQGGMSEPRSVAVSIIDDSEYEPNDESFRVEIFDPTAPFILGDIVSMAVVIQGPTDAVPGEVFLEFPQYFVNESDGFVTIRAIRVNGKDGAVSLDYNTLEGTAREGQDFSPRSGTLLWANQDDSPKDLVVPILEDAAYERDEYFSVVASNAQGGAVHFPSYSARVDIVKNDQRGGIFDFIPTSAGAFEEDGLLIIQVSRRDGVDEAVSVDVHSVNGTAVSGEDFDAIFQTFSWASGENTTRQLYVVLNDDARYEVDEAFTLVMSNPQGGAEIGDGHAVVTIFESDKEPGELELVSVTLVVEENIGTARIALNRLNGFDGDVSVSFSTIDGSAIAGLDFIEITSGIITWPNGIDGLAFAEIPIINDTLYEVLDESFNVSFFNLAGGVIMPGPRLATVTIIGPNDQVAGTLVLNSVNISLWEGRGNATIEVSRVGGSDGDIQVSFESISGSALAGLDFTAVNGTLAWLNGEDDVKIITVAILDDNEYELTESFIVNFSEPIGGAGMPEREIVVNIEGPNDVVAGTLFILDPYTVVAENGGTVTIRVNRTDGFDGVVTAMYRTYNGTAFSVEDYIAVSGTLVWMDGEDGIKSITISIVDDIIYEASNEVFNLTLEGVTGGASLPNANAVIEILGPTDQIPGAIFPVSGVVRVPETIGFAPVMVERRGGSDGAVSIDYATIPLSADDVSDFTAVSGTLSWANGEAGPKLIRVPVVDDLIWEPADESFRVHFYNPSGGTSIDPLEVNVTVIIAGQSDLVLVNSSVVVEESAGTVAIEVKRIGILDGNVSLSFSTVDGSAVAPDDYLATSGTLEWGHLEGDSRTLTFDIVDDFLYEPADETFKFLYSRPIGPARLLANTTLVTIQGPSDQVAGTIVFGALSASFSENVSVAMIEVLRVGGVDGVVGVNVSSMDGSATTPGDYLQVMSSVSWENGDSAPKYVPVAIVDDLLYEPDDENFTLVLFAEFGGAAIGPDDTMIVTILGPSDRKAGTIVPYPSSVRVLEDVGTVSIGFRREGGSDGMVGFSWETQNGTAVWGEDFTEDFGSFSWLHGEEGWRNVTIAILDDDIWERTDETFFIRLYDVVGGPAVARLTVTITIRGPSDQRGGVIGFATFSESFEENVGTISVTVQRAGGLDGDVSIDYATVPGSAHAGQDYIATSGTLHWANGDQTNRVITVAILDDSVYELSEAFSLVLSNALGGADLFPDPFVATILGPNDAVPGVITFDPPLYFVSEEYDDVVTLYVRRQGGKDGAVSATFSTLDASATAGEDFGLASGMLTWQDQEEGLKNFSINILNDANYEVPEAFRVGLTSPVGGATLGTSQATVYIQGPNDGLPATLAFVSSSSVVATEGTVLSLSVARRDSGHGPLTARVIAIPTSATMDDFTLLTTNMSWGEGDVSLKTVDVLIVDDAFYEEEESFDIQMVDVFGGAYVGSAVSVTILLSDNTPGFVEFVSRRLFAVEEDLTVAIEVVRAGSGVGDISVSYATVAGSAIAVEDFEATSGVLSWSNGDMSTQTITLTLVDDDAFELQENLFIELSSPTNGARLGVITQTEVVVNNTDAQIGGVLNLGLPARRRARFTAGEGSVMSVMATRDGGSDGAVSVDYAATTGTAGSDDFEFSPGKLSWAHGETGEKLILVRILEDTIYEPEETFEVALFNPTGGASLGEDATAIVVIPQNDQNAGTPAIVVRNFWFNSGSGQARIPVSRVGGRDGRIQVQYETKPSEEELAAVEDVDYRRAAGTLTWDNADEGEKYVNIPLLPNRRGPYRFVLSLHNATGGAMLDEATSSATITMFANSVLGETVVQAPSGSTSIGSGDDWTIAGPVFLTLFFMVLCCVLLLVLMAWRAVSQPDDSVSALDDDGPLAIPPPNAKDVATVAVQTAKVNPPSLSAYRRAPSLPANGGSEGDVDASPSELGPGRPLPVVRAAALESPHVRRNGRHHTAGQSRVSERFGSSDRPSGNRSNELTFTDSRDDSEYSR